MVSGADEEDRTLLPSKTRVMATVIQKNGPRKNLVAFIYLRGLENPILRNAWVIGKFALTFDVTR